MPRCPDLVNTVESGSELLDLVDAFIFDCDGVIWRGNEAIPGVRQALAALRRAGKRCFFVTNSAVKSPAEFAAKFKKLGVDDAASPQDIYSTNTATARWRKVPAYLPDNVIASQIIDIADDNIG